MFALVTYRPGLSLTEPSGMGGEKPFAPTENRGFLLFERYLPPPRRTSVRQAGYFANACRLLHTGLIGADKKLKQQVRKISLA